MSGPAELGNYYLAQIGRRDQQLQIAKTVTVPEGAVCSCILLAFPLSMEKLKNYFTLFMAFFSVSLLYHCSQFAWLWYEEFHNRVLYYSWSIRSFDAVSDLCSPACSQEEAIQGSAELQCQQLHWSRTAARTGAAQDKMAQGQAFFIPGQRPRTNSSSFVQKSFCVMLAKSQASSKSL